jgi:hypothetical protein
MSDSRRKTPICGVVSRESEKANKRNTNRVLRRSVRQILHSNPEAELLPLQREVSDIWSWQKDGKLPFDPALMPRLMWK